MSEFVEFLETNYPTIISAVSSVIVSSISLILLLINKRKYSAQLEIERTKLKAAQLRATYTVCPHCGKEIKLSEMKFYLPDGSKDQDLDGVAD